MSAARLIVPLVIVLALATGCGGSGGSDEADVEDTITTYFASLASGDGRQACAQLTGNVARSLLAEAMEFLPELRAVSCSDLAEKLSDSLGGAEQETLESIEVDTVRVNGDSATATIVGGTTAAQLTKEDGGWFISGGLRLAP